MQNGTDLRWFLLGALTLGCTVVASPPAEDLRSAAADPGAVATPVATASDARASDAPNPDGPDRSRPSTASRAARPGDPATPARAETARAALVLPRDEAFLSAPLPRSEPNRYASFRETSRITVGRSHLTEVDLLSSGHIVAMSDDEATVRVYDATTKRLVANHPIPGFSRFETGGLLAFPGLDGGFVVGGSQGIQLFDARSGARIKVLDPRPVYGIRWSPDSRVLVAVGEGEREQTSVLHFFERTGPEDVRPLGSLAFDERVDAWDLSPDNRLLALAHYPSETVRVVDLESGATELFRIAAPRYAGDVAISPDGRFLAVGGDGLLLVDLLNSDRRAFYSYVKNNIGHVRFSPSGDAVFASSYDGRIRVFGFGQRNGGALELSLLHELRHAGEANVYGFVFSPDGRSVTSASGDRTIRTFTQKSAGSASLATASTRRFRDLAAWKELDPAAAQPLPPPPEVRLAGGRYVPSALAEPPRPSRILPGVYACKITKIYRLRDCWVHKDEAGRTLLTFAPDNLLGLVGVLYDDGPVVRYEATLYEDSTVVSCAGCEREPLHAVFRGTGKKYEGLLTFRSYYDPYVPPPLPPAAVKIEEAMDRFPLVLEYRGPLPPGSLPSGSSPSEAMNRGHE